MCPSILDLCGRCTVKDFFTARDMVSGGRKVYTEPNLGKTTNPKSTMAASKLVQLMEPRDSDFVNSFEKTSAVEEDTLKVVGAVGSFASCVSVSSSVSLKKDD